MRTAGVLLVLLATFVPGLSTAGEQDPHYSLHIVCPETNALSFSSYSRPTCPVRLVDQNQMLGDPSLAADPLTGQDLAIAMIHGSVFGDGPSVRSRSGLPFTTFTSDDGGATWDDGFFSAPDDLGDAYGEHTAATADPYGHMYVGSTYAIPEDGGFRYVLGAQKFDSVGTVRREQTAGDGSYNLEYIDPVHEGNRMGQTWFLFNPATDNMTLVWYEDGPKGGLIGIAWTSSDENDAYHRQAPDRIIRPCVGSTNPVLYGGWLYIGCQADADGFQWNPATREGQVELFRLHPDGGVPHYMGSSPLVGGAAKLGVRSDGRLALFSADVSGNALSLAGAFGRYSDARDAISWDPVTQYGASVAPPVPGERVVRANIQALEYREYSGVVHLILRTTLEPDGLGPTAALRTLGPKIAKCLVAIDERRGFLAIHQFDIGNLLNRTDPYLNNQPEMAYEDVNDDLLQMPPAQYEFNGKPLGETYQRELFVVADYGQAIFAEVVEDTDLRYFAPPPLPAVAAPVAAASSAGSASLVPVAGLVLALGLVGVLAASRRKTVSAAIARMKR